MVDVVDVAEIAHRLGVRRQTVHQWRHRDVLPDPDWPLDVGPVWLWDTIERWARETGRLRSRPMYEEEM